MKKIIILLIIVLFIQNLSYAQTNDDVLILKLDAPSDEERPKKKNTSHLRKADKNIIKIGLLSFIYGEIPLYYERYIRDFFSIQIGVGVTTRSFYSDLDYIVQFGRKYYYATSSNYGVYNWTGPDEYDKPEFYHDYTYRKSAIGPYFSVTPKFYFRNALAGIYLGPHFSYSTQYYKIPNVNEQGDWSQENGIFRESIKNKYVGLIFGGQMVGEKITLDMFLSAGYNFMQGRRQDIGYYYKELNAVDYEYKYMNRVLDYKLNRPYLRIDMSLGYVWGKSKNKKKNN